MNATEHLHALTAAQHLGAAARAMNHSLAHLWDALLAAWQAARGRWEDRRALERLASLEDHMLRDIGLSRSDVQSLRMRVARDGVWADIERRRWAVPVTRPV
jgi:uncharacterized protein YjiS (DUF1127 family)